MDQVVLATKVYGNMGARRQRAQSCPLTTSARRAIACAACKPTTSTSYQMHHIERTTPWEEICRRWSNWCARAKVLYVGSSTLAGWDIATAQSVAAARHFMGLVSEQSLHNLAAHD